MPVTEMITVIAVGLFFLTAFVYLLKLVQAWLLHRTLRDAINRDSAYAGNLVDRLGRGDVLEAPRLPNGNDDRTGLVLVAIGIALAGFSLVVNDIEWLRYGLGAALFPTLVGAALLLRHRFVSRSAGAHGVAAAGA